jgi:uncharacterized membrane protein
VDLTQVAAALSFGATAFALVSTVVAASAVRAARRIGSTSEAQLNRISHQLATLDQAWYWTSEWQEGEAEADADLAEGRTTVYNAEKDFLKALRAMPAADTSAQSR